MKQAINQSERLELKQNKATVSPRVAAFFASSTANNVFPVHSKMSVLPEAISAKVVLGTPLSKDNEYTVNLSLPSGVRYMSTKSVVAKVTLADATQKTIKDVNIATKNLDSGLTAQAATKADSVASIIAKGTKSNLKD